MRIIEVQGVCKQFGTLCALNGVNLKIDHNKIYGLIGPNGSGKTTLMKAISGAHFPDKGTICFLGQDITCMNPHLRSQLGLSIKFQITSVFPELCVYDNLLIAKQAGESSWKLLWSRSKKALHEEILEIMECFHLQDRAYDRVSDLSHGEQQWLEISMATHDLLSNRELSQEQQAENSTPSPLKPRLLLLDEPTAGMSKEERKITGELLLKAKQNCAILIVEHDLDFIKDICDHIIVLSNGEVLDEGTPEEIESSNQVIEVYTSRV
jgi:branched-chain amino acid transport system ATP-binding protein